MVRFFDMSEVHEKPTRVARARPPSRLRPVTTRVASLPKRPPRRPLFRRASRRDRKCPLRRCSTCVGRSSTDGRLKSPARARLNFNNCVLDHDLEPSGSRAATAFKPDFSSTAANEIVNFRSLKRKQIESEDDITEIVDIQLRGPRQRLSQAGLGVVHHRTTPAVAGPSGATTRSTAPGPPQRLIQRQEHKRPAWHWPALEGKVRRGIER